MSERLAVLNGEYWQWEAAYQDPIRCEIAVSSEESLTKAGMSWEEVQMQLRIENDAQQTANEVYARSCAFMHTLRGMMVLRVQEIHDLRREIENTPA